MPNSTHQCNAGMVTSGLALELEAFNTAFTSPTAVGTINQAGSNFVRSIANVSAGLFTVQLNQPFPPGVVNVIPDISVPAAGTAVNEVNYVTGSYNSTTGQFQLVCATSASGLAAAPTTGQELHCFMVFKRYNRIPA